MGLKPQTTREWVIVILGGVAAVTVLLYGFVIAPGQELLDRNETGIQRYRKQISDAQGKVQRQQELRAGLLALRTRYSNYVSKINDIVIPRDIDDQLRIEFARVDKQFGSDIRQTQFSPLKTNEIHKTLEFTLNNVLCNWRSLHAALQAIETAGHLVGFESMRVSFADEKKTNVNVRAYIDVKSFIFPERGIQAWRAPNYAPMMQGLGRDIFGWPEGMIPLAPVAQIPALAPGQKPPWANTLQLTAIVKFQGWPHAVIRGRTDRKEYRYLIGSLVSNAMNIPVKVVHINATNETVILQANDQTAELALRDYRVSMFAPFAKRFSLFGDTTVLPSFGDAAAVPSNAIETVTVPELYEKPLGSYAEAQMKTGLIVLPIDQYVQRRYRLEADHGLLVYNLQKLGVAEKGGLQKRDIIISVANKRVNSRESFTYVLNDAYKLESIPVTVLRGGKEMNVQLTFDKARK
jgi:hypothetical protein